MATTIYAAYAIDKATGDTMVDIVGMGTTRDEAIDALRANVLATWAHDNPDAGQRVLDAWWDDFLNGADDGIEMRIEETD